MPLFKSKTKKPAVNAIIAYKAKIDGEALEYRRGQADRRHAWVTCKEKGCNNPRANGSSRCSSHTMK